MFGSGRQLMINLGLVEKEVLVDDSRVVKVLQNIHNAASIPVVSDSTSVVDVSSRVFEHFVRYFGVLHEEHLELAQTNSQVAIGELVWDIEAEWTKFSPLECNSVEERQREEKVFEYLDLDYKKR